MVVGADLVFWIQIIIIEREQVNHTCNSLIWVFRSSQLKRPDLKPLLPQKATVLAMAVQLFPSPRQETGCYLKQCSHNTVLWAHYGAVCRTSSKDIISWGKLKPAGAQSNSARDARLFSRWGTPSVGKQRSRWLLKRLAGDTTAAQRRPRRNTDNTTQNTRLSGWHLGTSTYLVLGDLAQEPLLLQTNQSPNAVTPKKTQGKFSPIFSSNPSQPQLRVIW